MKKGIVTVVIPIYKTEAYLDRCISSVVNQTYQNLEIILVDDGSPDQCPQMCNEWAKKDRRIRVIHKQNEGLGMARNTGIENATGEYICFFDSDDYVDLNTIKLAYEACKKEQADVVLYGFVRVDGEGGIIDREIPKPEQYIYIGTDVQDKFLVGVNSKTGEMTSRHMSACAGMYSLKMISKANWRFASERDVISEDVYSLLALYRYVNKVVILEEALYYYCENQSSLTNTYREDRFEKVKIFYEKYLQLCRDCEYSPEVERRCAEPFVAFTIALLKQETEYHSSKRYAVKRIREILSDELLQKVLQEKKKEKMRILRKVLLWVMRHKWYHICYCLLKAKNTMDQC